ncbi:MAG: hypothetical protein QME64_02940, partial [bacterium]|nr:hypothetical protein [bacterium]
IADHLKTCASCQQEYQELKQLGELAQKEVIPIPEAEDRYWTAAWQKIESKITVRRPNYGLDFNRLWAWVKPQFRVARLAYTTAVFCIGLLLGGYMFRSSSFSPQEVLRIKPIEKPVVQVQYQEVPKLVEKTKYRVRYVVLEPTPEKGTAATQPVKESAPAVIAVSAPETQPPDVMTRNQILQVQQELQQQFDEHNVSKQIARILGNT